MSTIKKVVNYLKGVKAELRKVRWSKKEEIVKDFAAVVIIVFILLGFFIISDALIVNMKDWLFK